MNAFAMGQDKFWPGVGSEQNSPFGFDDFRGGHG
jgi:hypothetical protein